MTAAEDMVKQPSANFHPNLWGDHFLSHSPDYQAINAWQKEADSLKEKVKEKLINAFKTKVGHGECLKIIDTIERLGIAYHFEEEIEQVLNQIFINDQVDDDDLLISAFRFRLLQEHGYKASSDVFTKFKDVKNGFKNDRIDGDVHNLLSLYEASYLKVHGEVILEEALEFTTTKLRETLPHLKPILATQVRHALSRPIRKALPRVFARDFISFYQDDEYHDELLLKFAKLDFNMLQKQHQEELSIICSWWKNLDMKVNFPFARDRIQECYFWLLGVYYEPQYAMARIFLTKVLAMTSIIDDMFDNIPRIHAELELFTQAFLRWDINYKAMEKLTKYMKILFQVLIEVYDEMEGELAKEGGSFAVRYAKEEMKNLVKAYHEESKWLQPHLSNKLTPTMEEYMKVALETTGHPMLIATSFVGMGDTVTHQAFNWLISRPRMVQATSLICRLMDDIVSHEFEQQREHVPSAVECYMQYYRVSEEEACRELYKQVENAWKDLNEAFFDPESPPMPFLTRILNYARVMDLLYKKVDGYTHSTNTKCYLVAMLVDPLEI